MLSKVPCIIGLLLTFFFFSNTYATTFTVSKTADTNDGACNADCSLREAITAAVANGPGADTINFNIPGGGVKTIDLTSELPEIETSLTINGATQPGYFGKPMIEVNGAAVVDSWGVRVSTPVPFTDIAVTIIGLAINRHTYGIQSECIAIYRCDITLLGNFIGTDPTGTIPRGNYTGVNITPSNNSVITIGGDGVFEGNLISGNSANNSESGRGIAIDYNSFADANPTATVIIKGNKIGTNYDGDAPLSNTGTGVYVSEFGYLGGDDGDLTVLMGGTTALARNLISGNNEEGVELRVSDATVIGNYIGTNAAGTAAIPNGTPDSFFSNHAFYISAQDGGNYLIGGSTAGSGNLISGNNGPGLYVSTGSGGQGTASLIVKGNSIGTNAAGTAAIPNDGEGISISTSSNYTVNTVIGGVTAADRNLISGNLGDGISIGSGNADIYGNYIGTDKDGAADVGNQLAGIRVTYDGHVQIGGTLIYNNTPYDAGNLISGNNTNGIEIPHFSNFPVTIRRNKIGTNVGGTGAIPNSKAGISVSNSGSIIGSNALSTDGNVISGNLEDGILLLGGSNTSIFGNKIGTNSIGGSPLPNGQSGIEISSSAGNQIGATGNGLTTNIIAGNTGDGILITGNGSTGNKVENNIIGTGPAVNDLGNGGSGVHMTVGASGNFVGSTSGTGNTIVFNAKGVWAQSGTDNEIRRNAIFTNDDLGIDLDVAGVTTNDLGDGDIGGNRKQNFPVLGRVTPSGIGGTLNSTANGNFTIDFYRVDSCDANGYGEGRYYLGSTFVTTDGSGNGSFNYPAGVTIGQLVTATATVTNIVGADDTSEFSQCKVVTAAPAVAFSVASYSVNEGGNARTIIVNRTGATDGPVSVDYATSNGTAIAGQDYTAASGTLNFADGETIKTFDVLVSNDTLDEPDETINLTLSNPTNGAGLGAQSTAVLTIVDNDNAPAISISDVSASEGNSGTTNFTFVLSLSAASGQAVSVNFATGNGSATSPGDFAAANGPVSFAAGETTKNVVVSVVGDTTNEPDENFFVNLSGASNASIADSQGAGTIVNDDTPVTTWSIRGVVRKSDGTPMAGVTVTIEGTIESQVTSAADGRYVFGGLTPNGNYTVSASQVGYTFDPASRVYQNLANDVSGADFNGTATAHHAAFDYDGDGRSDISIFRPSNGQWWLDRSTAGVIAATFGTGTDKIVPADYTGDGKTDIAFWRPSTGEWFVLRSEDSSFYSFPFGANGDIPMPADFDGDGKADAAVFRPTNATWYISKSTGGTIIQAFGVTGDVPVADDYDGDGQADIAIYRPSNGQWWLNRSTAGVIAATFGTTTDKPVHGDFTGDGKADIAFWRPASGEWYVQRSEDSSYYSFPFGANGDKPSVADFDGDGRVDAAVFRNSNATWYVNRSSQGVLIQAFGAVGDTPTTAAYTP